MTCDCELTSGRTDCKSLAPTWEKLAETYELEENVVIAKVDAEAENSKATAKAQGVSSYPTIKYWKAGSSEPVDYQGGRTEDAFITYINEQAGTDRVAGGGLGVVSGTVAALDALVKKYTGGTALADVAAEIKKEAAAVTDATQLKYAEYYVRVFDKLNKSDGYVAKELARLDGILSKGGLAPAKRDEITRKTNVLRRFVEKVESVKDEL